MKAIIILLILSCSALITFSQSTQLEVEGHVKIRGNIDIAHKKDNSSVIIGRGAGISLDPTEFQRNTFVGLNTGRENVDGVSNAFFGANSGTNNNGNYNSFFGSGAGYHNISGFSNSFFGTSCAFGNQSGHHNAFFGTGAGHNNIKGSRNTFIGYQATNKTFADSLDRAIAIGYQAKVGCHRCAVIGGTGEDAVKLGLGTTTPSTYLTLVGSSVNDESDFAITSPDALIDLGLGQGGPHGFAFGDQDENEGMKLIYRSTPNQIRLESGNDFSEEDALFIFALNGKMYASALPNIGDRRNMQYNDSTGEIGWDNSSRRDKMNIKDLDVDFEVLLESIPKKYNRPYSPDYLEIGFIAEDFHDLGLIPLVEYDSEGYPDGIRYDKMVAYIVPILKKYKEDLLLKEVSINRLKNEIDQLKQEIAALRNMLIEEY